MIRFHIESVLRTFLTHIRDTDPGSESLKTKNNRPKQVILDSPLFIKAIKLSDPYFSDFYSFFHSWAQRKLSQLSLLSPLNPLDILLSINGPLLFYGFNRLND